MPARCERCSNLNNIYAFAAAKFARIASHKATLHGFASRAALRSPEDIRTKAVVMPHRMHASPRRRASQGGNMEKTVCFGKTNGARTAHMRSADMTTHVITTALRTSAQS